MKIDQLSYFRNLDAKNLPGDFATRLFEALQSVQNGMSTMERQSNTDAQNNPAAPPAINKLSVTGQNGHFNVQITDNSQIFRGIKYYVEHSTTPNFSNPQIVHLGDSRNTNLFLGNGTHYFRAYSAYASSPPSQPVYHGGASTPLAVSGGGSVGGPMFQTSQSSGTGLATDPGLQGPGQTPFRTTTGQPPTR